MAKIVKVKTGSKYEEIGSYSRVVAIDDWIYVSNTAGRNPETGKMSEDPEEQVDQVLVNIKKALAAVDASLKDVVRARIFIQHHEKVMDIMTYVGKKFKGIDPAMTITCPPLGSPAYEIEIEVTALRGAANADIEYVNV